MLFDMLQEMLLVVISLSSVVTNDAADQKPYSAFSPRNRIACGTNIWAKQNRRMNKHSCNQMLKEITFPFLRIHLLFLPPQTSGGAPGKGGGGCDAC